MEYLSLTKSRQLPGPLPGDVYLLLSFMNDVCIFLMVICHTTFEGLLVLGEEEEWM